MLSGKMRRSLTHFRVTWRRTGASETFTQKVAAIGMQEAFEMARKEAREALGDNFALWELLDVERVSPRAMSKE